MRALINGEWHRSLDIVRDVVIAGLLWTTIGVRAGSRRDEILAALVAAGVPERGVIFVDQPAVFDCDTNPAACDPTLAPGDSTNDPFATDAETALPAGAPDYLWARHSRTIIEAGRRISFLVNGTPVRAEYCTSGFNARSPGTGKNVMITASARNGMTYTASSFASIQSDLGQLVVTP